MSWVEREWEGISVHYELDLHKRTCGIIRNRTSMLVR